MSSLETLNYNLSGLIYSYLDLASIYRFRQCSRSIKETLQFNGTWKNILANWIQHIHSEESEHNFDQMFQKFPRKLSLSIDHFRHLQNVNLFQWSNDLIQLLISIGRRKDHLKIDGVRASSQDFNQSIFRTLNRKSYDSFWSSTGSNTPDDNEFLLYQVAEKYEKALIHSVTVSVFRPRFQPGMPLYPPRQVQFEVGDADGHFYYKSKVMDVQQDTDKEQEFSLTPDVVIGNFIKVKLIGKPATQETDNLYYIALRYVGISGVGLSEIEDINLRQSLNFIQEEEKETLQDSAKCSLLTKDLEKCKELNPKDLQSLMFDKRSLLNDHFEEVYDKVLTQKDFIDLLMYSYEKYGNVDQQQSFIVMKIIDKLKQKGETEVVRFLAEIQQESKRRFQDGMHLQYDRESLHKFLYDKDTVITTPAKKLFLKVFCFHHELFAFVLKNDPSIQLEMAFDYLNYMGYQISLFRGLYLDVEYLVQALVDTYGKKKSIALIKAQAHKILWDKDNKECLDKVIEKFEEQIKQEGDDVDEDMTNE